MSLKRAQLHYRYIIEGRGDEASLEIIRRDLKTESASYRELDPTRRYATTVRGIIRRGLRRIHIQDAREHFETLKITSGNPSVFVDAIRDELRAARASYASLDPEGKRSSRDMKAEVTRNAAEAWTRPEDYLERQIEAAEAPQRGAARQATTAQASSPR